MIYDRRQELRQITEALWANVHALEKIWSEETSELRDTIEAQNAAYETGTPVSAQPGGIDTAWVRSVLSDIESAISGAEDAEDYLRRHLDALDAPFGREAA